MKNEKEIFEALLMGKEIRNSNWDKKFSISMDRYGDIITEKGTKRISWCFSHAEEWEVIEEPKGKVRLYLGKNIEHGAALFHVDPSYSAKVDEENRIYVDVDK